VKTRPRQAGPALPAATAILLVLWLATGAGASQPSLRGPGVGTRGGVLFSVPLQAKAVALTFDDGPSSSLTPAVLRLLRAYGAKATFFPIGREIESLPELARQVLAEGHEIGCHTYSHTYLRGQADARLRSELDRCEKLFPETLGFRPSLLRFPGLAYNEGLVKVAGKRGYTVVSCSLDSYDWRIKDPKQLARRITGMIRPGDIVLLHDGNWLDPKKATEALAAVLRDLHAQGYRLVTVSELIRLGQSEAGQEGSGP
jgi:peptidoglycan/xylan/chitin deacetylase (PgdA/CDA1 family)